MENCSENEDNLNDSNLYISSNWSTGAGGCQNYTEFFGDIENGISGKIFEYEEKISKTHHF